MSAVSSHSLSIGIVGLPNAGKSTLFNSLTENQIEAANYPFTTIDKNVGVVEVPDDRLDALAGMYKAEKKVPAAIKFVDIAGLVKGASEGEGLGNMFLSHIREVDVIMYVLRAFESETISHVYERVSPKDDLEIVQSELILKDLVTIEKKHEELKRKTRSGADSILQMQVDVLGRLLAWLNEGKPAVEFPRNKEESAFLQDMWLLSDKKRIFILNTREGIEEAKKQEWYDSVADFIPEADRPFITEVDVKALGENRGMSLQEQEEYIELLGARPTSIEDVIKLAYERLNLITFYTGSEKECNAWAVQRGATAKQAAGVIHSDLADGFITAEILQVADLIELGGHSEAKDAGKVKNAGKEYEIQDGEYILIHHN